MSLIASQLQLSPSSARGRAIRKLLVEGVGDPYTRFVTPQQFEAMSVFDVTGIGLNLGSTDDYSRKVGFDRPTDELSPEVWSPVAYPGFCLCFWLSMLPEQ